MGFNKKVTFPDHSKEVAKMEMNIKDVGNIKVVRIVSRFDAYTAKEVEAALNELIDEGCRTILCDFSETEYISSAGLRVLLAAGKRLKKNGGMIALCSLQANVREVFDTAGFSALFDIYQTEKEALEALQ